ncbi:MAG: amino acid permease [Acidimicrobiaceae bacterium]|nr:amino acid permease [Acidimicrobiaceae bacterium]MXW99740.1 amino acid permease [Acidimicrobiaceae bacterium]MYI36913.1 amino acid permease [Acidimicrobiaceae bacterium]
MSEQGSGGPAAGLSRSLGLRHVFVLSTGAMLSSGLFLLPGLAAADAGPSAVLAYALAGVVAVPAMLSVAELSTAMPRAGGAYYFLVRAYGPAVGTFSGMATWLSLVLKDAFALVGMSAYLNIVLDVPAKPLAVVLIAGFTIINVLGTRASAGVQMLLVGFVLAVMGWFIAVGLPRVGGGDGGMEPFFADGTGGLISVVGLVFVSYGGLTKVASAAEEINDPSRNIPLGMGLSLLVSTALYTLGVLVAVAVVPPSLLHDDLAPIYSAAEDVMPTAGAVLVVVAALAAFSSATNAGILAAARYPLAMSRDRLVGERLGRLNRFNTPAWGVALTGAGMAAVVLTLDVGAIAKVASAFVLLTLALVNSAVLVLRASRIASYAPGFTAPLFPYLQLAGIAIDLYLIVELGPVALLLTGASVVLGVAWYVFYGRTRSMHGGAIYHVFERWGRLVDRGLDRELSAAVQSHGVRSGDEYPGLIARAAVVSIPEGTDINEAAVRASEVLSTQTKVDVATVTDRFLESGSLWIQPSEQHPTATPVAFFDTDDDYLVIVRAAGGIRIPAAWGGRDEQVKALFFLAGCSTEPGRVLRLAGELAAYLHSDRAEAVAEAAFEAEVKEALLPDLSIGQYPLMPELSTSALIGRRVGALTIDAGFFLEAVSREGRVLRAEADLVLEADDQITVLGPPNSLPVLDDVVGVLAD